MTLVRRALIRLTVPESSLLAQTERSPKASAYGERPTRIRACRRFVRALIRVTRAAKREPTQTLPAPYAIANGSPSTRIFAFTCPAAGSILTRRPPVRSVTQSAPPPARTKEADSPTCSLAGGVAAGAPPQA